MRGQPLPGIERAVGIIDLEAIPFGVGVAGALDRQVAGKANGVQNSIARIVGEPRGQQVIGVLAKALPDQRIRPVEFKERGLETAKTDRRGGSEAEFGLGHRASKAGRKGGVKLLCGIVRYCAELSCHATFAVFFIQAMSKRDNPRIVFELEPKLHRKAGRLAKKNLRKTVSAHAKAVYVAHLESK